MWQHVHAEDAVKASDVNRTGQIDGVEGDQAAQARLDQQVRRGGGYRSVRGPVRTSILQAGLTSAGRSDSREVCPDHRRGQARESRLRVETSLGDFDG